MTLELSAVRVATAFAAGAISFLSPCVLPLVPAYVSYVTGQNVGRDPAISSDGSAASQQLRTLRLSFAFVLGFTTVFVILGAGANALSSLLAMYRYELNIASGGLVILFGLFTTGLFRPLWAQRELRWHGEVLGSGAGAAYLIGIAFAFGWTPCIGPVLGAILAVSATSGASGAALLAVYSLGLGVPFILAALFLSGFMARIGSLRRAGRVLQIVAGSVMIAMGVAMITGHLTDFAILLLETFPALGRIG